MRRKDILNREDARMQMKALMSRRDFFELTMAVTSPGWLAAQAKLPPVVIIFTVTDNRGRYISGLKSSDLRVFEDGIPQTISTFATSGDTLKRQREQSPSGDQTKPRSDQETFESIRDDLMNSYRITYDPDPSNHNKGFRRINIEIVSDADKKFRVRHRPGYRPESRFAELEKK